MDGIAGATRPGNTRLVSYGIQTEVSDIRVHVSVATRRAYVYPTSSGLAAVQSGKYRKRPAFTGNIITAEGYLIPPDDIEGCKSVRIPDDVMDRLQFSEYESTTIKGEKAIEVTKELIKRGLIPITLTVQDVTDEDMQVLGADIIVKARLKFQVKCDWRAGPREYGGTGNLYLQVAECNPFKRH